MLHAMTNNVRIAPSAGKLEMKRRGKQQRDLKKALIAKKHGTIPS
jgi:hypothetical protein